MNELLNAMLQVADEADRIASVKASEQAELLRRIVYLTRCNIHRAEREHWLDKYQEMYPQESRELTATKILQIRDGIPLDNKPTT